MPRAWRTNLPNFAAYSGRRSGPRMRIASRPSRSSSHPLMSNTVPRFHAYRLRHPTVASRELRGRIGLEGHLQLELLAVPLHLEAHGVADGPRADRDDELVRGADALALEADDDVAGLDPGLGRRSPGGDGVGGVVDRCALAGEGAAELDPDDRVGRLAGRDELVGGASRLVARDGEAEPDAATGRSARARHPRDRAVDADDLARHVEQRSAGVAGVDRGVGLDRVDEGGLG